MRSSWSIDADSHEWQCAKHRCLTRTIGTITPSQENQIIHSAWYCIDQNHLWGTSNSSTLLTCFNARDTLYISSLVHFISKSIGIDWLTYQTVHSSTTQAILNVEQLIRSFWSVWTISFTLLWLNMTTTIGLPFIYECLRRKRCWSPIEHIWNFSTESTATWLNIHCWTYEAARYLTNIPSLHTTNDLYDRSKQEKSLRHSVFPGGHPSKY
jgi:hypothetical protein